MFAGISVTKIGVCVGCETVIAESEEVERNCYFLVELVKIAAG